MSTSATIHFGSSHVEEKTGRLFGDLWSHYDDHLFKQSVEFFQRRWLANGEPPDFFAGKRCLDAGCGGGRYVLAMSLMGAESVVGVDVGGPGLEDARERSQTLGVDNVDFQQASVLDLPFPDEEFDFVCCNGVLHHTVGVERGLREIYRVLKPGGSVYLLLYGAGGLYWPLNLVMRAFAQQLGKDEVDRCCKAANLAANKRRTVLDDLFVPVLETYTQERVEFLLHETGFKTWRRWGTGQMDHESDPNVLADELDIREQMWRAGALTAPDADHARQALYLAEMCRTVILAARDLIEQHRAGRLESQSLRQAVIGNGHHRMIAEKA